MNTTTSRGGKPLKGFKDPPAAKQLRDYRAQVEAGSTKVLINVATDETIQETQRQQNWRPRLSSIWSKIHVRAPTILLVVKTWAILNPAVPYAIHLAIGICLVEWIVSDLPPKKRR
jgi:hypothetical protein